MSNDDEWGPWIEHDGSGCPVADGVLVEAVYKGLFGNEWATVSSRRNGAQSWNRAYFPEYAQIIRYRVRRPKALQLLRDIAASPPKELIREDA